MLIGSVAYLLQVVVCSNSTIETIEGELKRVEYREHHISYIQMRDSLI